MARAVKITKPDKKVKDKKEKEKKRGRKHTAESLRFIGIKPVNVNAILEVSLVHLLPHKLSGCWICRIIQIDLKINSNLRACALI